MMRSIRSKVMVGFLVIFCAFFFILNGLVARNLEAGNRQAIEENLIDLKNNSSVYFRQAFLIHHFSSDDIYYAEMAQEMGQDLVFSTGGGVQLYTLDGKRLYSSDQESFALTDEDLNYALQGKEAYNLTQDASGAVVSYSYPVIINGSKVGIARFSKDVAQLYSQSRHIRQTIFVSTMAVFTAAFLFAYLLSRHITVPLAKLAQVSSAVRQGDLSVRLQLKRKDEIGQLADNFNSMIATLGKQIAIIREDRNRLEELYTYRKRFFDNVTHELKTPLTTILGYAEIIRESGSRDAAMFEKGIRHIIAESKRLQDMVLRLLEMSKASGVREDIEPVPVTEMLREVCEAMAIRAERYRLKIEPVLESGLQMYGQPGKLRQLMINLLDNAIKYADSGTVIRVTLLLADDRIRFAIANRGETIEPEQLGQIFEPFYRAGGRHGSAREGAGLGLAISRDIVAEHQGRLELKSREGITTAVVTLPAGPAKGEYRQ